MPFLNGIIRSLTAAFLLSFIVAFTQDAFCQKDVLETPFTFRHGTVKTDNALEIISRESGFSFTYDSRIIDPEKKTDLDFRDEPLRKILKYVIGNDSLMFSVVDRYIIISRPARVSAAGIDPQPGKKGFVTGIIRDEETGEPLPYATIGIIDKGKGTVTNRNGEFVLNITDDMLGDTLSASYLGYRGRQIPVSRIMGNNLDITMPREYISIPEIIIRNQIPQEIIQKVLRAIPANYGNTPAMMNAFYREGVLRKTELQTYSEAVIRIYKSAYSGTLLNDQINVHKSRKIENLDNTDTLAIRLKAGLSTCLELDGARNIFDFIDMSSIEDYNFRLADIVTYDNESAYAIEFEQKEQADLPLFRGTLYINTSDFGIFNADFEISPSRISKIKESFITSSAGGFLTWPVSVHYSVSYRKIEGRYFLSHVRGDLVFASKQKRKLFSTQFRVFFELAVTGVSLSNVRRFDREELAPVHSIFSKTITTYDHEFWGDQDFLRPEENLLQAINKMRVRLQEFR